MSFAVSLFRWFRLFVRVNEGILEESLGFLVSSVRARFQGMILDRVYLWVDLGFLGVGYWLRRIIPPEIPRRIEEVLADRRLRGILRGEYSAGEYG